MDVNTEEAIDQEDLVEKTIINDRTVDEESEQDKSAKLKDLVSELVGIKDPYASATKTVYKGTRLREQIRKLALDGVNLPEDSDVYVGMKKCNGRVSWKDVAHQLAQEHELESELQTLVDSYDRKPMYRMVCGHVNDDNYDRAQQLDLFIDGQV